MSPSTPRLLGGRYEVDELIGRGGMAEVHKGYDTRLGRPVAIKILRSDHARDMSFLHRFRREAQSVAGLNHRSIVAVYDSGEDQHREAGGALIDVPYIVMEFVEGRTLREVLNADGPFEPDEAARVVSSVLDALAYSHQMGIVHRDIKPGNVMIGDDGAVKVMDFGIARAVADTQATMTATSAVIGTAQYIPPEQARGETVDNRSDIYSTGCLLFELLTGRTPYTGEPISLTYQHVNAEIPRPSEIDPNIPTELDAITSHALTKDRDHRYQDAAEMADDLRSFQANRPISPAALAAIGLGAAAGAAASADVPTAAMTRAMTPPADPPISPAPEDDPDDDTAISTRSEHKRRGPWGWIVAFVLLLALAGVGLWALSNRAPEVEQVSVPAIVGMDKDAADAKLRADGLDPVGEKVESQKPVGEVLTQDPAAGVDVDQGERVEYTYSGGPGATTVPQLEGLTVEEARTALENNGLQLGNVSEEDSPEQDKGKIIRSNPGLASSAEKGSKVDVVVASGKVTLPDLRGKSLDEAQNTLRDLKLSATLEPKESARPENTILRTSPGAGKVDQGATITLTYAIPKPEPTTTTDPETDTPSDPPTDTEPDDPTDDPTDPNDG